MTTAVEIKMKDTVDQAMAALYEIVWGAGLSGPQAQVVWLEVAGKMITSACMERKTEAMKEALGAGG